MKMKKNVIALGAALLLMMTGCGEKPQVNVEQASMLTTAVTSSDKFAGMVVSENVVEIERDTEQKLDELFVSVGDTVRVNEKLFEYDTDTLSLTIDKQQLEIDKLTQQIKDLTTQKTNVEKQIKEEKAKKKNKQNAELLATLDLNLRSVNADLTTANYDKKTKQAEMDYNKDMLKNAAVRSPIKGIVRSINESGSPYITIQQDGAFQVKGTLNELSLNAGIMEGVGVTILSRTDPTAYWTGTVTAVDYNTTDEGETDNMYGGYVDPMASSTSYPFYITLDSTEGLLLGHMILRFTDEKKETIRFGFVIVDDSRRGAGIGKRMLGMAVEYATHFLKAKKITIGVLDNNPGALRCYLGVGFHEARQAEPVYYDLLGQRIRCIELEMDV